MLNWMRTRQTAAGARGLAGQGRHRPRITCKQVVSIALVVACSGCAKQKGERISMTEYQQLQASQATPEVLQVAPERLVFTDQSPYQVQPRDTLTIKLIGLILEQPFTPTALDVRVHDDGQIQLPSAGSVHVAGLSLNQVEQAITAAYVPAVVKDAQLLSVFVQLVQPEETTVLVLGAVGSPGMVKLPRNQRHVLYALSMAGGFGLSSSAVQISAPSPGRVKVRPVRSEGAEMVYDLRQINDVRRAMMAPPLESGDILFVEAQTESAIYLSGLVMRPGPIMLPRDGEMSVLRALAAAGGTREYLIINEGTLIRTMGNGEQVQVKLDLGGIIAGRCPDFALKAGDILHVPHTLDTLAQEWALRSLIPGPFNVGLHYDPLAQYNVERAVRNNGTSRNGIRESISSTLPNLFVPTIPLAR